MALANLCPWRSILVGLQMCVKFYACPSGWGVKICKGLFYRKTGHFSAGCLCAGLWGIARWACTRPLRTISLFAIALWVSWMWDLWAFKTRCWLGLISQVKILKVGVSVVGFKLFTPQEESLGFEFSPDCRSLYMRWSIWWDCVSASSTCFDVGFSLFIQCVGVSQLALGFLSEEIVPYVAVDVVCLWEMNSGNSYVAILKWILSLTWRLIYNVSWCRPFRFYLGSFRPHDLNVCYLSPVSFSHYCFKYTFHFPFSSSGVFKMETLFFLIVSQILNFILLSPMTR